MFAASLATLLNGWLNPQALATVCCVLVMYRNVFILKAATIFVSKQEKDSAF